MGVHEKQNFKLDFFPLDLRSERFRPNIFAEQCGLMGGLSVACSIVDLSLILLGGFSSTVTVCRRWEDPTYCLRKGKLPARKRSSDASAIPKAFCIFSLNEKQRGGRLREDHAQHGGKDHVSQREGKVRSIRRYE